MPGPLPKPTHQKRLAGNPGKRKLNDAEPIPVPGTPAMPTFLSDTAREEWTRICAELEAMGLLAACDLGVVAVYVTAWAELVECENKLREQQSLLVEVGDQLQPSPWISLRRRAEKTLLTCAQHLGLSPAARSRITVEEKADPENELNEFIRQQENLKHPGTKLPRKVG